jgi:protein-tyrosine phosphatase
VKEHILFICEFNLVRSVVAESLYSGKQGLVVQSAGIHANAQVPVDADIVKWADRIFVMEACQRDFLKSVFKTECRNKEIICLDVSEDYKGECFDLQMVLAAQLTKHLGEPVLQQAKDEEGTLELMHSSEWYWQPVATAPYIYQ